MCCYYFRIDRNCLNGLDLPMQVPPPGDGSLQAGPIPSQLLIRPGAAAAVVPHTHAQLTRGGNPAAAAGFMYATLRPGQTQRMAVTPDGSDRTALFHE